MHAWLFGDTPYFNRTPKIFGMRIILASESPRRKALLESLGIEFEVMPSNADESSVSDGDPARLVQRLAELKAGIVAGVLGEGFVVIAADTVVVFNGKTVGKPKDRDDARRMLRMLSGKKHSVHTGVCVINTSTGKALKGAETSFVNFRSLAPEEIDAYASLDITLGCAGAYAIQVEPSPVASVEGSYTNVVGLPAEKLIPMLRENGVMI